MRSASWTDRARHPRVSRGRVAGGHPHRDAGQGPGRGQRRYTSGRREIVELLRQRSRPYLFSNTAAPVIVATTCKALELVSRSEELRQRLWDNTRFFPDRHGWGRVPRTSRRAPHRPGDDRGRGLASRAAEALLERGST